MLFHPVTSFVATSLTPRFACRDNPTVTLTLFSYPVRLVNFIMPLLCTADIVTVFVVLIHGSSYGYRVFVSGLRSPTGL